MSPTPLPPPQDLDDRLRAEPLLPLPPGFLEQVADGLPSRRPTISLAGLARLAAAVLIAAGVWVGTVGALPRPAHAEPSPEIQAAFDPALELVRSAPGTLTVWDDSLDAGLARRTPAWILAGGGLVFLAGGLLLAARFHRHSTARPRESTP